MNRSGNIKTAEYISAALAAGLIFLTACASSRPARPGDLELFSLSRSGRSAFERGDYKLADRFYRMARQRALVIDDPGEIGTLTYNLAAARLELGETEAAAQLLREARRAFMRGPGVPVDLSILQGRVALLEGKIEDVRQTIEDNLTEGKKEFRSEERIQIHLLRARLALADGDLPAVRVILDDLDPEMSKQDKILNADFLSLKGELLFREEKFHRSGEAFDREAELLQQSARYRGMTRARQRAGRAYLAAGDFCPAGECFYRAARSLAARGKTVSALENLQSALTAAEECPEENLREEVGALFVELKRALDETLVSGETE